jgi:hypothetical protein
MTRRRTDAPGRKAVIHQNPEPKKTRGKRRGDPPELPREAIELAVLALVRGGTHEQAAMVVRNKGIDAVTADAAVREAVDRLALAADFDRRHELGLAIQQLRDVYASSMKSGKATAAFHARRELNKVFNLYNIDPLELAGESAQESESAEALKLIDGHLRQVVGLCVDIPDDYPIYEIARIAANIVRRTID